MDAYVFESGLLGGLGSEVLNFGNVDELEILEVPAWLGRSRA